MREKFKVFRKKKLNGSSTIEVSLIMPIILTILFLVIYLSLFLYARAGSVRLGYLAVLRGSQLETESKRTRVAYAKKEFAKLKEENYLGSTLCQGTVTADGDTIKITVETTQNLPNAIFVGGRMYEDAFYDASTFVAKTNHPVDFIRKCRKIQKGAEKWNQ